MQRLLAALGARLAPPPVARRLDEARLPQALHALYAISNGAELPLVGWRIVALHELVRDGDAIVFTDEGHRLEPEGRVTHLDRSWESVEAFLSDAVEGSDWAKIAAPARASAATAIDPVVADPVVAAPVVAAPVVAAPVVADPVVADPVVADMDARTNADAGDLLTRVCRLVEAQGYRAILTGNRWELRLQGESGGSWYSIEPWIGRDEPGLAQRIAERFVRRERARNVRWNVRCDAESMRTDDLSEVVNWARRSWRSLRVDCEVAEVSLGLYRDDPDHLVSFEWHGGRWQARAPLTSWQVQATLEHLLLRRDKWPGLEWSLMRQPPS